MSEERFFGRKIVKVGEYPKGVVLEADCQRYVVKFLLIYYPLNGKEPIEYNIGFPEKNINNKYQFDNWIRKYFL